MKEVSAEKKETMTHIDLIALATTYANHGKTAVSYTTYANHGKTAVSYTTYANHGKSFLYYRSCLNKRRENEGICSK